VGREEVACWRTKAAISLKHVKIEEKLLWTAYTNSPTLFRTVPSPTPYGLSFPKIGVRNPRSKLQSKISGKRVLIRGIICNGGLIGTDQRSFGILGKVAVGIVSP